FFIYKKLMSEVALRSTIILADSEHSRNDVLAHLQVQDPGKVTAIHVGVSERFLPMDQPKPGNQHQLLYVGRLDPYKNVTGVIRVLSEARKLTGKDIHLRIIGPTDLRYPEAPLLVRELGLEACVHWAGYVSDDELPIAYRSADALLLLSRYEGFGLPVAEAMASGTPVVCSNVSSLPEIAGDAALQVAPDDLDGAARAVAQIIDNAQLAADLRKKGLQQASRFTWRRTAEQTLRAYEAAAAS
ncbi:MAG: glycosyltransferase family 1 protein, partial [Lentisphaerota bacterium]